MILADPVLRAAVGGLRQISAPVDELAGLQIRPDAVLIVENKEPALAWSDTAGLVVIHSLGQSPRRPQPPAVDPPRLLLVLGDLDRYDQPDSTLALAEASALAALELTGGKYLRIVSHTTALIPGPICTAAAVPAWPTIKTLSTTGPRLSALADTHRSTPNLA